MYAQINYSQKLGSGPGATYTIAEAGCFLTAFCNLLTRFGEPIDPPSLNSYFVGHSKYVDVDGDQSFDDLAWGTISAYDGQIATTGVGGTGWPDSNDAIVKFIYKSLRTGHIVTHFTLVQDAAAGTIVDSWDGQIKHSPYGTPVAWAKYERHAPQVVSPPPPAANPSYSIEDIPEHKLELKVDTSLWDLNQRSWPGLVNNPVGSGQAGTQFTTNAIAHHVLGGSYYMLDRNTAQGYNVVDCQEVSVVVVPPVPVEPPTPPPVAVSSIISPTAAPLPFPYSSEPYEVLVELTVYNSSNDAVNKINPVNKIAPGSYFKFYSKYNMLNITKTAGKAGDAAGSLGGWIDPSLNVEPPVEVKLADVKTVDAATEAAAAPTHVATEPVAATAPPSWQADYKPFNRPIEYITTRDIIVLDLEGRQPNAPLPRYNKNGVTEVGVVKAYGKVPKDGIEYYRLKTNNDPEFKFWYCVPVVDLVTHTPNLLVKPLAPIKPINKMTIARDAVELAVKQLERDAPKFLDDILPKWFKNKK